MTEEKGVGLKAWLSGPGRKESKTKTDQPDLDRRRIAILPLSNISPDPRDEYFADGLTEELITTLSRLRGLQVIARTSVMPYKTANKRVSEIGRELEVGTVLEGSVRKIANKVRVTTQLIETTSQTHIWSNTYDRELDDIFAVQTDIATQIADALRIRILPDEKQRIEKAPTKNTEAFSLYLNGRFWFNKRTKEATRKSITLFNQAAEADPSYPLAYVGIADAYSLLRDFEGVDEGLRKEARPIAERNLAIALRLDEQLSEAHTSLASISMDKWDWAKSESEFLRSIELNPSYVTAHHWYSILLRNLGRMDEALTEIKKARRLDPLTLVVKTSEGIVYRLMLNYEKDIALQKEVLEMDPNFEPAVFELAIDYAETSRVDALSALRPKLEELFGEGRPSFSPHLWVCVDAMLGRRDEARRKLREAIANRNKVYVASVNIAIAYVYLGETDEAVKWLEIGYTEKDPALAFLKAILSLPVFEPLQADPRSQALVRKIGLST